MTYAGFVDANCLLYLWPSEFDSCRICIISGNLNRPIFSCFLSKVRIFSKKILQILIFAFISIFISISIPIFISIPILIVIPISYSIHISIRIFISIPIFISITILIVIPISIHISIHIFISVFISSLISIPISIPMNLSSSECWNLLVSQLFFSFSSTISSSAHLLSPLKHFVLSFYCFSIPCISILISLYCILTSVTYLHFMHSVLTLRKA